MANRMESSEQNGGEGKVEVTFKDNVAIITMKRGQNRFNEQLVERIHLALDEVLRNPNAKALVTTGEGKFYSNGLDLPWLTYLGRNDPERLDRFIGQKYRSVFFRILTFPIPTVALLNGHAFAAGGMMALAHDHMIMQNARGWWCLNEVHINLRFHPSMIEFFKIKLPKGRTFHEVLALGRRFTGDEAKQAGIVQESCAPKDMFPRALAWIRKVVPPAGYNRQHLQTMKEDIYQSSIDLKNVNNGRFGSNL